MLRAVVSNEMPARMHQYWHVLCAAQQQEPASNRQAALWACHGGYGSEAGAARDGREGEEVFTCVVQREARSEVVVENGVQWCGGSEACV